MKTASRRGLLAAVLAGASGAASAQQRGDTSVRRLAWAGVALRVGDVELFIDARAPDAETPGPPLSSAASRRFALVTHHHGDHLDLEALGPLLGERGYLVCHEDVARLFDNRILNLQTVRTYEPVFLSRTGGEFVAWCVPAADGLGGPQVSWVVDGGGKRVIHCGDTLWHGGFFDTGRAFGPFDAAFLPINGARQVSGRFTGVGQGIVMTPEQAASAAAALAARLAVPVHYGAPESASYAEERHAERRFVEAARQYNIPVRVLAPGESMDLR